MRQRALVVGIASVAIALALGVTAWLTLGREEATAAATDSTSGDSAAVVTPADSAAASAASPAPAADSAAARTAAASDTQAAAGDSALARLPHPPNMLGAWVHGDGRSMYGDSLSLLLRANGTASAVERRWQLDKNGWHSSRVEREGGWSMRYRGGDRVELCTDWTKPQKSSSCDRVYLLRDTASASQRGMQYAGRHWKLAGSAAGGDEARAKPTRRR